MKTKTLTHTVNAAPAASAQLNLQFSPIPLLIPFPTKLDLDGHIATNWKRFKRSWTNYEIASGLISKDKRLRTATFLTCIGSEAMDVFDGFEVGEDDQDDFSNVINKFELHCFGKTNVVQKCVSYAPAAPVCGEMSSFYFSLFILSIMSISAPVMLLDFHVFSPFVLCD